MTIVYPANRKEVADRIATDIQNELPALNPFLRESIIRSLAIALGGRLFDIYTQIDQSQTELSPVTATVLDFIRRDGLFKGIDINPSSAAVGNITATGTATSIILQGTIFQTSDGTQYEVINQDFIINSQILNINSLTRSGDVATAVLATAHQYAPSISIAIAGADQTEYNGTFTIIDVPTDDSFTYQITGTPLTPATGTVSSTSTLADVEVQSVETGRDKNLEAGAKISLTVPLAGVDNDAYVQFGKISGGADEETTEEYRDRVLEAYSDPISNFNSADVRRVAKTIPGVTRVWVFDATPESGDSETYFTRDNDADIIPDPTELSQVKTEILKIKSVPTQDHDVYVLAPTKVTVNFTFTNLEPDSDALRDAIEQSLTQLFKETPNVSENLSEDAYRSSIYQTINPKTGEFVKVFALSTPIGDVSVAHGELAVLGNITWDI